MGEDGNLTLAELDELDKIADEILAKGKKNKKENNTSEDISGIIQEVGKKDKYTYLLEYNAQMEEELRDILETYFPDRWELQEVSSSSTLGGLQFKSFINSINADTSDMPNFVHSIIRNRNYVNFHDCNSKRLIIHFPEIKIKNSRKSQHTIKDLWITMNYNFLFRVTGRMNGFRSTKTFSEYQSRYNHSHLNKSSDCCNDSNLAFCLGSTDYSTLTIELTQIFSKYKSTLFFQQLGDYLAWESLEGGPHMRMEEIGNRAYNISNRTHLNHTILTNSYLDFLRIYPSNYNIQLNDNGYYHHFKVIVDEEFKSKVEYICPVEYKMLYDTVTKTQYIEENNPTSDRIKDLNNQFKANSRYTLFTFKGKPVCFQILDSNIEKEKVANPNIIKMAPEQMIMYIASTLEKNINNYYIDKLEKELEETK